MRIMLESTSEIVEVEGVECRIWEGATERGTPVTAFIRRLGVRHDRDTSEFERELRGLPTPAAPWLHRAVR